MYLNIEHEAAKSAAGKWLMLGVFSLVGAGFFSILLVLLRTPVINELIPLIDFFHVALVVHVDLSVLIWFISFAGVLWSIFAVKNYTIWDRLAINLAVLGTIIIIISPFIGADKPLMNNYIPILDHPIFIGGLMIFTSGWMILIIRVLLSYKSLKSPLHIASYLAAITSLIAILALFLSHNGIPDDWSGQDYYEMLFWGGGHILQFTHTIFMLVAWFIICSASGIKIEISPRVLIFLFVLVVIPVDYFVVIYMLYDVVSAEHRSGFTDLMRYGGLASVPLGGLIVWYFLKHCRVKTEYKYLRSAFIASMVLFLSGGVIAFMIDGVNVVIPAHYHGSIVGVTLSFMGLTYFLLPKLGFGKPSPKLAHIQPYIYGGGQLLHIIGLAWSGGYGVARKTAGAEQGLDSLAAKAGMGLMGLGGLISIIGGLLFVVIAIKAFNSKE